MTMPNAYCPEKGYRYQILVWDNYGRSYDHCDYAIDKEEKTYLCEEYALAYGNGNKFKVIRLPKKYWPIVDNVN
jgi:hypothetical protein